MRYTDEQVSRMDALMDEIDTGLETEKRTFTRRDVPALTKLAELYASVPPADYDEPEDFENAIAVTWYLGEAYAAMERYAPAAAYFSAGFLAMAAEAVRFPAADVDPAEAEELLATAIRARNYFEDDDCDDLTAAYRTAFGENAETDGLFACRGGLLHDPVEATEEYLAVIDGVDEALEAAFPAGTTQTDRWAKKAALLAEKGIAWRSPAVLNGDTHFH